MDVCLLLTIGIKCASLALRFDKFEAVVALVEGAAVTHEAVVGHKVVVALKVMAAIGSHISLLVDSTGRGVILESVGLLAVLSCRNLICSKYLHIGNDEAAANHLLLKEVHLFLYTMPSYVLTSIIVVKFGMYLVKYNLNDCKSSKIELLELFLA